MKKLIFRNLLVLLTGLFLFSCLDKDKDLYDQERNTNDKELDLSFKFSLKSEKTIVITAKDGEGLSQKNVMVGIYPRQPYTKDGIIDNISPLYIGYTDENGVINASVPVAAGLSKLYVVPLTSGFGSQQEVEISDAMLVNLQGVPFRTVSSTRATGTEIDEYVKNIAPVQVSNLYNLYNIYNAQEVDGSGVPLQGGSKLISKESLSTTFVNRINSWYPEKQNVQTADLAKNSDLVVTDPNGAEVWLTYVGDGGFSEANVSVYNVLTYYNYTEGELSGRADISSLHMTIALPNTNELQCPSGLKIQLLYWDEGKQEYSTVFPKDTHIGFGVARQGFKKESMSVAEKGAYSFKNSSYPQIGDPSGFYFSTPALNPTLNTQSVTRTVEEYNCCISGFDIRRSDDPKADFDFNDVLFKIISSPVLAIKPSEDIPVIDEENPTEAIHGTLAFEDQWPSLGDYDFNDAVINYTYSLVKNSDNQITEVNLSFTPIAKGAAAYTTIGFGIELPIHASDVNSQAVQGAILEDGNPLATMIIWDLNRPLFGKYAFVNTQKGEDNRSAEKVNVSIPLKNPVSGVSMLNFNPFIFVNQRSKEIHLVDNRPTSKMDFSLFGTKEDRSDSNKGIYFRMDNYYPWALDFPRETADTPSWRYPLEKSHIKKAYVNYEKWVMNKSDLSWFDSSVSGNVVEEELY